MSHDRDATSESSSVRGGARLTPARGELEWELETERVSLRRLRRADLPELHRICADRNVMRYIGRLEPLSLEQTRRVIEEALASYDTFGYGPWAFLEKESGVLIGYGGLEMLPGRSEPEVSYILAEAHWGRGYATELASALLRHGFARYHLSEIGASIDPGNRASIRVVEKIGMRFEERGEDEHGLPTLFYTITRPSSS